MADVQYLLDRSKSAPTYTQPGSETDLERSASLAIPRARSNIYHFYPEPVEASVESVDPESHANSVSIFLTIFITFLSNVVFSIVLPSLPDYLKELGASTYLNGWAVAVNSLGTFLASPLFGLWADRRNFREVFFTALLIMAVANVWYALVPDMYQLFISRFFVGVAGASFAPASSYLSYATLPQDRAKVMTWNAASSVLGFICGPSFALLTSLPSLNFSFTIGEFHVNFNAQTAPGWVSAIFALLGMFCLLPFKEIPRATGKKNLLINEGSKIKKEKEEMSHASIRSVQSYSMMGKTSAPLHGVLVCLFYTFAFTTTFTIFETIGPLYLTKYYGFDVFHTSLLFLGVSAVSLLALAALQLILYFVKDDRVLMVVFGFLLTVGLVVMYSWDSESVSLLRFCVGLGILSIGYADAAALLLSLFSKLLEEREQGVMMGWLSSTGCIARMACPIGASYIYNYVGANYIFLGTAVLCFISNMVIIFSWQSLDPYRGKQQIQPVRYEVK